MSRQTPRRLLADGGAMSHADIESLSRTHPGLAVYAPTREENEASTEASRDRRARNLAREADCLKQWRARMKTAAAIYARWSRTEHVHAKLETRGFGRMLVRRLEKVRSVCLLHAVAHGLLLRDGPDRVMHHTANALGGRQDGMTDGTIWPKPEKLTRRAWRSRAARGVLAALDRHVASGSR